jgi:hypothetical protein
LRVLRGGSWSAPKKIINDGGGLVAVSCPAGSDFCATVDSFGQAFVDRAALSS